MGTRRNQAASKRPVHGTRPGPGNRRGPGQRRSSGQQQSHGGQWGRPGGLHKQGVDPLQPPAKGLHKQGASPRAPEAQRRFATRRAPRSWSRRFCTTPTRGLRPPAKGFTLLELLIAVVIIAILASIALPYYRDTQATGREAALVQQIGTLAVFQENTRLRTGAYGAGTYNSATGINTLTSAIGWNPAEGHAVSYFVTADGVGSWRVTATDESGFSVCRELPANVACD